jgi:hypothetical protein
MRLFGKIDEGLLSGEKYTAFATYQGVARGEVSEVDVNDITPIDKNPRSKTLNTIYI